MAFTYRIPSSSNFTITANNTTHPVDLQNSTSVYPSPAHSPDTSSTEYRIFLGFLIFGIVAAVLLLLYIILIFALSPTVRSRLPGKRRQSKDEQTGLELNEEVLQESIRRPERVVLG
jgi:flagellar biosynthesis/type III secretory pathway M-ring protein FliF/YscJ